MRRALLSTLLALVTIAAAAPALAQSAKKEAGRLFSEGNDLYDKREYAAALEKFEAARARYPSYKIDLNIGTVLVELGRPAEAAETYEVFLARGSALAPPDILASARAKLDDLRTRLARISVSCPVSGATIKVDDKALGTTPHSRPIYLQPGEHRIEACKEGYSCASETLTATAGEQRELALSPREERAPTATPEAAVTVATAAPPVDRERRGGWKATTGWVAVGIGGASLITGVIFGAMVSSKSDDHAQAIADGKTYGELQEIADAGRGYETAQIATLVVGGVALAAGGGLLLWHYLGGRRVNESRAAFVAPLLGTGLHGLAGGLRF